MPKAPTLPAAWAKKVWAAWPPSAERSAMTRRPTTPKALGEAWRASESALAVFDQAERVGPDDPVVAHKRVLVLTWQVQALLVHRDRPFVAKLVGSPSLSNRLALGAARCIAAVPTRFKADSPLGAACCAAWHLGHTVFAAETGHGRAPALKALNAAMKALARAPRTHAEGRLKSAQAVRDLLEVGRSSPWFKDALLVAAGT